MEIRYKNSYVDLILVNLLHQWRNWFIRIYIFLGLSLMGWMCFRYWQEPTRDVLKALIFLFGFFAFPLAMLLIYMLAWVVIIRSNWEQRQERVFTLLEEGITENCKGVFLKTYQWKDITRIERTRRFILIYLGARRFYAVPVRVYAAKIHDPIGHTPPPLPEPAGIVASRVITDEADTFYQTALSFWKQTQRTDTTFEGGPDVHRIKR